MAPVLLHPGSSHTEAEAVQAGEPLEVRSWLNVQRALVMRKAVVTVQMWMQVDAVAAVELKPVPEAMRRRLLGVLVLLFLGQQAQEQQDQ